MTAYRKRPRLIYDDDAAGAGLSEACSWPGCTNTVPVFFAVCRKHYCKVPKGHKRGSAQILAWLLSLTEEERSALETKRKAKR